MPKRLPIYKARGKTYEADTCAPLADVRADYDRLAMEWTVPRMAERCGLGVTQFVHHSKQLTNMTPARYLNHCRLEAAARLLLEDTSNRVTEIAAVCGFSSSQYCATVFRRHFGKSPRAYRETQKGKRA
jgi:AraC family L-rhamnose operon regulatory protein RhaS